MTHTSTVLPLHRVDKHDTELVGVKAAHLGEMSQMGFPIPDGFVITAFAYRQFLEQNNLIEKITPLLETTSFDHPDALAQTSEHIKRLIKSASFSHESIKDIDIAYNQLGGLFKHATVALRPSPTTHDTKLTGQPPTVLDIKGEANLIVHIKEIWSSLFDASALFYRQQQHIDHFNFAISIIVQKMIPHEKTGYIFTSDPATGDKSKIIIEAHPTVSKHDITPDHYEIRKTDLSIIKEWGPHQKIRHNHLMDLALLGKKIEQQYYFPQEVLWALHKNTLSLLATKPINLPIHTPNPEIPSNKQLTLLLKGIPASHGIASGPLKVLTEPKNVHTISQGDIVALHNPTPAFLPAIKKAAALIVDQGGRTSYAANVARQLGIPAIVGTQTGTHLPKNIVVTVNGTKGEIYKGAHGHDYHEPRTATKIYTNSSEPLDSQPYQLHSLSKIELETIKKIQKSLHHVFLVLPPVLTTRELTQMKHTLLSSGIHRSHTLQLWIKIATPAQTFNLEEFIKEGIDGILIDIRSLTAHMLGLDPQKKYLLHELDQVNPAILLALERAIKTAHQHHIHSSVQFTDELIHPSLLEKLVEWGVSSVSVEPHTVDSIKQHLMRFERKLIENNH